MIEPGKSKDDVPLEASIPDGVVSLESILCTDELRRRPWRPPDYGKENRALVALASALAESPRTILQTLADTILEVTQCGSAGVSLLTTDDGGKRFYWPAIAGIWKQYIGGGTPRNFGPCGDVLDRNTTLLFRHLELRYTYFLPVTPPPIETLLVPFYVGGKAVGTIWALMHDDRRKFDAEDERLMGSLGKVASLAYQTLASIDDLKLQIAERDKAETELHKLTNVLEGQVVERTAELTAVNEALRNEIAQRARSEQALAETEDRLTRMADSIPEVIWITDLEPTERVVYANPSFERIWGLRLEDLYRNPRLWTESILLEDRGRVTDTFARWISGAKVDYHNIEYRIVQPGGGIRWIHERGVLTLDEHGRPCLASGISTDITERKEAENALRRSESYLAEAQKLSRSGSFGWNISTGEVFWSEESYRIIGYGLETKPTLDLVVQRIHPDDRARVKETLECAVQTGTDLDFENRLLMPDGTVKFVHVLARAFKDGWGSIEFTGMVMDLTDRKRAEEVLHQAQAELAHVTRMATLGELTASIAHEINQPLAAVVNNASACLRWLAARNLEEARNSAALVVADGHRAGEIISRIRALIKKAPPQKDWVDINGAILQIIALIRSEVQKHNVSLRTQLAYDGPLIWGDRIQLQQVFLNLIVNAIEAMSGMIAGARELAINSSTHESSAVKIEVRDSGPGLGPTNLDHIFDAFYTTKPQGMGMGLAISRSIVEDHGGRLWVTAHEGQGAVFQFILPIEGVRGQ